MEEKSTTVDRPLSTEEKKVHRSAWNGAVNPFSGFRRGLRNAILIAVCVICALMIAGLVFVAVRFGFEKAEPLPGQEKDGTLTFTTYAAFKAYMEDGEDGFVGSTQVLKDENGFVLCEYHANRRGIKRIEYLGTTDKYLPIRVTPEKNQTRNLPTPAHPAILIACAVLIFVIALAGAIVIILIIRANRAETRRRRRM